MARQKKECNTRQTARLSRGPFAHSTSETMRSGTKALHTGNRTRLLKEIADVDGRDEDQGKPMAKSLAAALSKTAGRNNNLHGDGPSFSGAFQRKLRAANSGKPRKKCPELAEQDNGDIDLDMSCGDLFQVRPDHQVCHSQVHWRVRFASKAKRLYREEANVQPMHKSCNRSKGGFKGGDSPVPVRREKEVRPGESCCPERTK